MADSDVIKEFLVGLGFKVDQKGLKNFTGGIDNATRAVGRLVTTITASALTVAAGVSAFASNLEGLYFASQRIGASADSLKAADYAARDLGASAAEVRGSLEGMARFMRDNPGGEGFIKSLGVETRDAKGNLKDTADLMVGLGQRLRAMPWYQAKQYASVLGIDDNTLRAITSGEFGRKLEENRKRFAGAGLNQATRDAHQFMESLRDIGMQFEALGIKVQAELLHRLGPDLKRFADWFDKNSPMIAQRVGDMAVAVVEFGEEAGPYLKKTLDFFVELDKATDGWSTKLLIAAGALRMLAGGGLLKSLPVAAVAGAGAGGWWVGSKINDWIDKAISDATGRPNSLGGFIYDALHPDAGAGTGQDVKYAGGGKVVRDNNAADRVIRFFQGMGWTQAQASGIAANLSAESRFNPQAIGDGGKAYGVAQWHPDRQANFKAWAGKDIRQSDLEEQLRFVHYELTQGAEVAAGKLLRAASNAEDAGAVVSRYYERPAAADAEAASRAATAVQFHQNTEINVHGVSDPNSAAMAVAGEQGRVSADIIRNLNSAVQ